MFALGLKSGYPHVEIFSEHRKFLPFAWDFDDGEIRYFSFCVSSVYPVLRICLRNC